jgi:hypothetical protein
VQDVLRSPGQPFDATTRGYFEPRFGHDFSDVRVHTDAPAAASAREVKADAYTVGRDIVFDAGRFMPGTHEGRRLLAHELTHVVQQTGGTDGHNQKRHMPAHFPDAASAARPIPVQPAPGIGIARQPGHPPGTPLSAEELFQIIVTQRAFTFSRGGAPAVDPAGVGRGVGPQAGGRLAGQSVFAVVQITDSNGNLADIGYGEHTAFGAEHAEPRALRALEHSTAGRNVRGGRMLVVLDQFPCPPGRADCMGGLRNFARDRGLTLDIRVPQRPSMRNPAQIASPRSSARGVQRTDFPAVQLVPIEQAAPPAGDGGGAAPPGHGPGRGTPPPPPATPPATGGGSGPAAEAAHTASTVPPVTAATAAPPDKLPVVTAHDLAAEMAETEASNRRMATHTRAIGYALEAYNFYGVLEQIAGSLNMAASTAAKGSPYRDEMRRAADVAANAKELADYYDGLDLHKMIPPGGWAAWDGGWYSLQQLQFDYYQTESHLHDALVSVDDTLKNIGSQISDLADAATEENRRSRSHTDLHPLRRRLSVRRRRRPDQGQSHERRQRIRTRPPRYLFLGENGAGLNQAHGDASP